MKEIIFRGKRKDNKEWVQGYYFKRVRNFAGLKTIEHCYIQYETWDEGFIVYEVYPKTVSQFTGLVDKHGKKIFEGDILAKGFELYEVRWNPEQVRWGIYLGNYEVAGFTKFSEPYFEVIGNVYDNKELLELLKND